jgi:Ca2+-binding RTX toxin-like protein
MPHYWEATEGDDRLQATLGGGAVNGLGGDDYLYGTTGSDDLDGGAGDDWLEGLDGDDILRAGAGGDAAFGGLGTDTLILDYSAAREVQPGYSHWSVSSESEGGYGGRWNIDDTTYVSFQSVENFHIRLPRGHNWVATGDGDDWLIGGPDGDRLYGGGGDDLLEGGGGWDNLYGGSGNDIYVISSGFERVFEEADGGEDELRVPEKFAGSSVYLMPANVEVLTVMGTTGWTTTASAGDNRLRLSHGHDRADLSQGGNDHVSGGAGNDQFYFGTAYTLDDRVDGGAGYDMLILEGPYSLTFAADSLMGIEQISLRTNYDGGRYDITMHDGNVAAGASLTIFAYRFSGEVLTFNGAAETDGRFTIWSGNADDTITGGGGDDVLHGGGGADHLRGGRGADTFHYGRVEDSTPSAFDIVYDFEGGSDRIDLWSIDADGNAANGDSKFAWIGGAAFSGTAGELRAVRHSGFDRAWVVEADTNGDTVADFMMIVVAQRGYILSQADFLV